MTWLESGNARPWDISGTKPENVDFPDFRSRSCHLYPDISLNYKAMLNLDLNFAMASFWTWWN